jgi:hypothetical protein
MKSQTLDKTSLGHPTPIFMAIRCPPNIIIIRKILKLLRHPYFALES